MARGYKYSTRSHSYIESCKKPMQDVCYRAMEIANTRKMHCPDFGISCGTRTETEQFALYLVGRKDDGNGGWERIEGESIVTNCDGIRKKSVHQSGLAIDFYAYVDGAANYDDGNIALIATCFFEAASELGYDADWGGSFRSISDGCHFEVKL